MFLALGRDEILGNCFEIGQMRELLCILFILRMTGGDGNYDEIGNSFFASGG